MLHPPGVRFHLLQRLRVHPGQHFQNSLERAHLLDLAHAVEEIVEIHSLLADFFLQPLRLGLIEGSLRLFNQCDDVTHLKNASGHSLRMEFLEGIGLLANTDVLDRLLRYTIDRQRRTTTRVAIHLGQYHPSNIERLVETLRDLYRVLPGHAVGDEQNLRRTQRLLERAKLLHHRLVYLQAAGGVDDHDSVALA